jgi:hypothetical protein
VFLIFKKYFNEEAKKKRNGFWTKKIVFMAYFHFDLENIKDILLGL